MIRWTHLVRKIEGATRTSEKAHLLAEALRDADDEDLQIACRLFARRSALARADQLSWGAIAKAVEEAAGAPAGSLAKLLDETGDLGTAAAELVESERPLAGAALQASERDARVRTDAITGATGVQPDRDTAPRLREIPALLDAVAAAAGQRRHDLLVQMLYGCSPIAVKYLVRLLSGDMRIGLRDGLLEAAIAEAFSAELNDVRWAMTLEGDAGSVALLARRGALNEAQLRLFHPIPPMLAAPASTALEIVDRLAELASPGGGTTRMAEFHVEDKYDGVRAQLHVETGRAALYGRDLDDVSVAFPEIIAAATAIGFNGIMDGEIIAIGDGRPLPVAALNARLGAGAATLGEQDRTPVVFVAFDVLAIDGAELLRAPRSHRRAALDALGLEARAGSTLRTATMQCVSSAEELEAAFIQARMRGGEGLVAKAPDAPYAVGRRSSAWLKMKHALDTLDCVIVGAEPGVGRRREQLCELTVAVRDDLSGRLAPLGRAGVTLDDGGLAELSAWFEAHTLAQLGQYRSVEPRRVVEVAFDDIRRAEHSASGFTLRSPRVVRVRDDLGPDQAATLSTVEQRFRAGSASGGSDVA